MRKMIGMKQKLEDAETKLAAIRRGLLLTRCDGADQAMVEDFLEQLAGMLGVTGEDDKKFQQELVDEMGDEMDMSDAMASE